MRTGTVKRRLLIVDDIRSNREILKNMLGDEYDILEAAHGEEALAVMTRDAREISAVLLDLGMPVMDGFEVLSRMQQSETLSQLPVIVTTGQTDSDSEERALKLGAKDYISKPYKSAIIKQRIWNTINLRETAATVNALQRDPLTGLFNRETFFERAGKMVAARESGHYVMACFDVDNFKVINDQYGTQKGDEVLRHIAAVFDEGFGEIGGLCCRVAADHFAVLYPASYIDSETLAALRRAASDVDGLAAPLAFSIGRYVAADRAVPPSAMYDRAMLAAASVKGRYDTRIAVYDESMRDDLLREQEIVTEMESALHERQFEAWYQPQYNHSTGALVGSEALARWRHPEKGLISPATFIPIFEKNGFIYSLDKYIWEEACRFLRRELDEGASPLPVSVNISRRDVFRPDFLETVTALVARYGIPAELLRLEITESAFAESPRQIVEIVTRLIDAGFTLEIDDFGSGYSSLNTLKDVPAQVVKLDMRFLEDGGSSDRGGNILESIVRMTKWLGMSVIAEGVETRAQADFLRSVGCNYIQGYLYAKPMPEAEYRALCRGTRREERLLTMESVENLDNNAFWDPKSMDTLIFNSFVGGACIYEYHDGGIELLRATEKYTQMLGSAGMSIEEALRLNWTEHLDDENRKKVIADLEVSIATKREITGDYVFRDLPGCPPKTYLRSTMRVIAAAGERYLVYCTNENMTAQRKAEESERRVARQLQSIMENVHCGITVTSAQGERVRYLLTNDKYFELIGYTPEQYRAEIGERAFSTIYPEDRAQVMSVVRRVNASGAPETMEYRALRRDGSVVWLRSNVSMTEFEGESVRAQLSTYTDVSAAKQTEQILRDTTRELQRMMDDMPGGYARMRVNADGSIVPVYVNRGLCKLTGMERDALMALYRTGVLAEVHPDDLPVVREVIARMLQYGEANSTRYRLVTGAGGYIWLSIFGRVTKDENGDTFLNIYYTDATEQLRAEEQQRELLDNLPYGAALYELAGERIVPIHLNRRYWELVEREPGDYATMSVADAIYPDDRAVVAREVAAALRQERDVSCDVRVRRGDGQYRPFHIAGRILKSEEGRVFVYAAYTPISDEAMSIQDMLPVALQAMMSSQTGFSFVKDRELRYVCCSREMYEAAGLASEAELLGKTDFDVLPREEAARYNADDRRVMDSGESMIDHEDRRVDEAGTAHYNLTSKYPLKDSRGAIIGLYGVGRDVTETHAMRSQLELLTNNIPGGIAVYEAPADKPERLVLSYFSDGYCRIFGYTREEYAALAAESALCLVFEEDLPALREQLVPLLRSGTPMDCVFRTRAKNGGVKWINCKAVLGERRGARATANAVLFDVSERQEALERLRISEEENRLALRQTGSTVCRFDVAGRSMRVPESLRGKYALSELLEDIPDGPVARGEISPDTAKAYVAFYESIFKGGESGSATYQRRSGAGWRWLESHYSTIFSETGAPVSAVLSFSDITDQVEKDTAYKRWQQSLRDRAPGSYTLFRCNISKRSSFDTREGALLTVDFGSGEFDFDDHTDEYVKQYVLEEDRERFTAFLRSDALLAGFYQGKRIVTLDYRERQAGGNVRWLRLTVDLVEHPHSTEVEAYMLFEDIDRLKRVELATLEQAETDPLTGVMNRAAFAAQVNHLLSTAAPGAKHALLMMDIDGFKQVNDAFGHGAGDEVLIDLAEAMRAALRHGDLVGRLGGDEFVIFLPDIPGDAIAASKAQQICALSRKSFSVEVEISGSVGIVIAPRDGADFETLYKKADAALYHVKGSGKDNFAFYHEDMADEHLELRREESAPGVKLPVKKRRILIVDDSRIDHAMLTNIFSDEFIVEKAKDGNAALIRLRHYGAAISVVLLDLMMPGMDGFAVLKKMQESAELRTIPVIVVSGDEGRETSLRAIRCGATDFVSKPVDPEVLRIRVSSAIGKAENERLRAKNSMLEYQNGEIARYRTVLERSGTVVIEDDWINDTFVYDPAVSELLAGRYDDRKLWHILLADMVADTATVKKMQELVHEVASDRKKNDATLLVHLRTPSKATRLFKMCIYKVINEFGLTGRLYITFTDTQTGT